VKQCSWEMMKRSSIMYQYVTFVSPLERIASEDRTNCGKINPYSAQYLPKPLDLN